MTKMTFDVKKDNTIWVDGCDLFHLGPFFDERAAKSSVRLLKFGSYMRAPLRLTDEAHDKWIVLTRNRFYGFYVGFRFAQAHGQATLYVEQYDSQKDAMTRVESLRTTRPPVINTAISIVED